MSPQFTTPVVHLSGKCLALLFLCLIFVNQIGLARSEENPIVSHTLTKKDYGVFAYTDRSFCHAESPVWDERTATWFWVDVLNSEVYALSGDSLRSKRIGYGEVNVVMPVATSDRLMIGVRSEVFLLDWEQPGDAALRLVAVLDVGQPDNVLNEGKADAFGRFWAGTKGRQIGDDVAPDEATLYSIEGPFFEPRVKVKPASISNGMVWSLNNTIFYYIDSPTKKIEAFDYDLATGHISKRRTIVNTAHYNFKPEAIPDGMTIDRDGQLWVAMMFDGSIIRIEPDSRAITERYRMPITRITSLAWGGGGLMDLMVTTSRRNMSPEELAVEPLSGTIFLLHNLGTGGVPANKVVFPDADRY